MSVVASGLLFGTTDQADFGDDACAPTWSGTQWEWAHALGDCGETLTTTR